MILQVYGAYYLANAYATNEVDADEHFAKRRFIVSGWITKIGKDILSNSYVVLDGEDLRDIQCFFPDDAIPSLAKLSPKERLSVVGTCSGLMGNVLMKDCEQLTGYVDPSREGITWKEEQANVNNLIQEQAVRQKAEREQLAHTEAQRKAPAEAAEDAKQQKQKLAEQERAALRPHLD